MQSFASRLMPAVMLLRGAKRRYRSVELTRKSVARQTARPGSTAPGAKFRKRARITETTFSGWRVWQVAPVAGIPDRRAVYLHGGAYVYEITPQHWHLVTDLANATNTTFVVPIYPLAPGTTASVIVPLATDLAQALIDEVGAPNVTLLGDSAGGGMALAVAMLLRDRQVPAPHLTVLISPWLDISGTDPQLQVIDPTDPWLAVPGSHAAGALYRGELPEDDSLVSPINGDLSRLGRVLMFSGTRDILNADAQRLVRRAVDEGLRLDFVEGPGMIHVWPLLPIPEARVARQVIREAMANQARNRA
ncbi:MAG: alpha/beta hydrolase [Glaciihabitans sp.]|nr:alpha/beta hydrolase [Glaciihabitans sp.]